jgi:hypothetical protein
MAGGPILAAPVMSQLQTSFIVQSRLILPVSDEGNTTNNSSFDVRRSNVTFKARVDPRVSALVTINMGSGNSFLNEAYAQYQQLPWQARLGLVRIPFGYEMPLSSAKVIPLERSRAITSLFSSKRDYDRGLFVYHLKDNSDFAVAVTNGGNVDTIVDPDTDKAVVAHIGRRIGTAYLGASYYTGTYAVTGKKMDRIGVDLQYSRGAVLLLAEAITGHDGDTGTDGGYGLLAYQRPGSAMQYYGRYDVYDQNCDAVGDSYRRVSVGANRYVNANTKLTVEYDFVHDPKTPMLVGQFGMQWQIAY